jgi:hypothetical protein
MVRLEFIVSISSPPRMMWCERSGKDTRDGAWSSVVMILGRVFGFEFKRDGR